jgi:hypothetical protein
MKATGKQCEWFTTGHERETPKQITVFCPRYQDKDTREQLQINGRLDFRELLTIVEG